MYQTPWSYNVCDNVDLVRGHYQHFKLERSMRPLI